MVSYHTVVIGPESLTLPNGQFEALKINQEKKTKLTSGEEQEEVSSMATEHTSYWLVKGVGVAKQESSITITTDSGSESIDLSFDLIATDYLPNYLWPEAETTPQGWTHVEWFGDLTDNYFPWIYHADHGWLYVDAEDSSEVKLWSESLGWWLTSDELYPAFFSLDLNDWLTFQENESIEREFVRSDGSVVKASNVGFTFRPETSKPEATEVNSALDREGDQSFVDAYGNRYTDSSGGLQQDQGESPVVELISPFENTVIDDGEKILIFADAYDKDGKIERVIFRVNGSVVHVDEQAPYQIVYTPPEGQEQLKVQASAVDNYGNESSTNTVLVEANVSIHPPKVRIDSPLNKTVYKYGDKITINVIASDIDGFVESVALLVDGIQVGSEKVGSPCRFSFVPPVNGNYQISAIAIDDDLNETESAAVTITVNETGVPPSTELYYPEIRVVEPLNRSNFDLGANVRIEVSASDEDGWIDRVQIYVDGIQIGSTLSRAPYEVSYRPPSAGSYTVTAKARDNDRNETVSSSVQFQVE